MIKSRALLRNTKQQNLLEKHLFLKTDFFKEKNYSFISTLVDDFDNSKIDFGEFQASFIDKFQSKIEYKCINCSPLTLKVIDVNSPKFVINKSVVLEEEQSSLSFIIPIFERTKTKAEVVFFNKCRFRFPRFSKANPLENVELPRDTYYKKLKYGEIIIAYNQVPFTIKNTGIKRFFIVNVLPYESRPFIFEKTIENGNIQSYQTTTEKFIDYELGKKFDLSLHIRKKSYPLDELNIEEAINTLVKPSLFKRFFEKFYEKK